MSDLTIQFASPEDASAILEIYRPYVEETAVTFEYSVPSVSEFEQRIRETQKYYPYLKAVIDQEIVGYAYAGRFSARAAYDWSVETSIYIKKNMRRCGIGRKLSNTLENVLSQMNIQNLNACIAWPESEDKYLTRDSARFHEALGYKLVGKFHQCGYKFDRWYNMIWMEKMLGSHPLPPVSVRSIGEIQPAL